MHWHCASIRHICRALRAASVDVVQKCWKRKQFHETREQYAPLTRTQTFCARRTWRISTCTFAIVACATRRTDDYECRNVYSTPLAIARYGTCRARRSDPCICLNGLLGTPNPQITRTFNHAVQLTDGRLTFLTRRMTIAHHLPQFSTLAR
jgi:hypothetical protein